MFRELGTPDDPTWPDRGDSPLGSLIREDIRLEAEDWVEFWEEEPGYVLPVIAYASPEARFLMAALGAAARLRRLIDRELLLLVAQADESGQTWTAIAQFLETSPQNAHKTYKRRIAAMRYWVTEGLEISELLDDYARRQPKAET